MPLWMMERVGSWDGLIRSVESHYLYWHGRLLAVFLNFLFLWTSKPFFDICNTAAILLLGCAVCMTAEKGNRSALYDWKRLLFVFCCFWYFTVHFATVFLWLTGSCNYVWTSLVLLLFLLPYIRRYYDDSLLDVSGIGLCLAGVLAGSTNENTVPAAGLFLLFLLYRKRDLVRYRGLLLGFAGLCIGYAVMMASPSIPFRLISMFEYMTTYADRLGDPQFAAWVSVSLQKMRDGDMMGWIVPHLFRDNLMGILFFYLSNAVLVIGHLASVWCIPSDTEDGWLARGLFLFGHSSLWLMIASPSLSARSFFMTELCAVAGILVLLRYKETDKRIRAGFYGILTVLFVACVITGGMILPKSFEHKADYDRFCQFAGTHRNDTVVIYMPDPHLTKKAKGWLIPFTQFVGESGKDDFINRSAVRYYGIKGIAVYRNYDNDRMVLTAVSDDGRMTGYSVR